MKFWKSLILGAFAVGALALGATSFADGYITGSKHDFSQTFGVSIQGNQICLPCHVPHGAAANVGAPENGAMWNHKTDGTKVYTLYASSADLDNQSRLCLSCHDGVYGVDNYGGKYGTTADSKKVTGAAQIARAGADLTHEHPIGARYPGLDAATNVWTPKSDYNDPAKIQNGTATAAAIRVRLQKGNAGLDPYSSIVGCGTCHSAHGTANPNFLRGTNDASKLCLTCHVK